MCVVRVSAGSGVNQIESTIIMCRQHITPDQCTTQARIKVLSLPIFIPPVYVLDAVPMAQSNDIQ